VFSAIIKLEILDKMINNIFHKYYFDLISQSIFSFKTALSPIDIKAEIQEVRSNKDFLILTSKKNDNINDGRRYPSLAFENELYNINRNLKSKM